MLKRVFLAAVLGVLAAGVGAVERGVAPTERRVELPAFPTIAVDQTRGPSPTTNLVDDPGEWEDYGWQYRHLHEPEEHGASRQESAHSLRKLPS